MIYYFWGSEAKYKKLIAAGYTELPCQTCDKEVLEVNIENKTFEIVHKHVNSNFGEYSEDVDFIINE